MSGSKKSKAMFKNLVKECLIEILAEGLINNNKEATVREKRELRGMVQESYDRSTMQRNITQTQTARTEQQTPRASYLDSITMGIDRSQPATRQVSKSVQNNLKNFKYLFKSSITVTK